MIRTRWTAWMAAAAVTLVTTAARAGEIRIWPTAVVSADDVRLADISELSGFDLETADRLGSLILRAAPSPGAQGLVDSDTVRRALLEGGAKWAGIRLCGAARCKVERPRPAAPEAGPRHVKALPPVKRAPVRAVSQNDTPRNKSTDNEKAKPTPKRDETPGTPCGRTLEAALRDYLSVRAPIHQGKLEIRVGAAGRDILDFAEPEYAFKIRPAEGPTGERTLGLVGCTVEISRDGEVTQKAPIVAELTLVQNVVVARKAINRGRTIEAPQLMLQERRFDEVEKIGLTDATPVIGQMAREFVPAGQMLDSKSVAPRPVVRRGDSVTIWRRDTSLMIRTSGRAMEDGFLGTQIRIRRDGTRRTDELVDAVVTGPGTVELVELGAVAARN